MLRSGCGVGTQKDGHSFALRFRVLVGEMVSEGTDVGVAEDDHDAEHAGANRKDSYDCNRRDDVVVGGSQQHRLAGGDHGSARRPVAGAQI